MPAWVEYIDVVQAVLIVCIGLIGWFASRTLTLVDRNQTELFRRMQLLEKELYMLKGLHEAHRAYQKNS
ncbi:hypothetical protein [Pelodictyon luteolum]|uniref:Uncharacterized protein n=1 Tax=Chlorobium luteolum (strain DSM 273 / BCRC 81028 / 2530) TaxID=319225 RepID=Q3B4P3_CHLL3|nr:hypothetical protein [Pelodictyon luteolum]ABB23688.1 hypothetical protein Plut_0819 [Pelodictyon luteolum DSM 273]